MTPAPERKFEDMGILEMCKTLGEMGDDLKKSNSSYAEGVRYGAETIWPSQRAK